MNAKVEINVNYSPELQKAGDDTNLILSQAQSFAIATADDYEIAAKNLQFVKSEAKRIEAERMAMTRPLDASKKQIMDHFRPWEETLSRAETAWKRCISDYQAELRHQQEEAERLAAEASRRERERLAAEAAKKEEAARLEREKAEAKALELEQQGKGERADALRARAEERATAKESDAHALQLAAATMPTAPVVHIEKPKVAGVSSRQVWRFAITNPELLPREYLLPDEKAIGAVVRALGERANIPGIHIYADTVISSRSA